MGGCSSPLVSAELRLFVSDLPDDPRREPMPSQFVAIPVVPLPTGKDDPRQLASPSGEPYTVAVRNTTSYRRLQWPRLRCSPWQITLRRTTACSISLAQA